MPKGNEMSGQGIILAKHINTWSKDNRYNYSCSTNTSQTQIHNLDVGVVQSYNYIVVQVLKLISRRYALHYLRVVHLVEGKLNYIKLLKEM